MKRRKKERIFTSLLTMSIVLTAQSMVLTAEGDGVPEEIPGKETFEEEFSGAEIVEEELPAEEDLPETEFDLAEYSVEEADISIEAVEILSGGKVIPGQAQSENTILEETARGAEVQAQPEAPAELVYENDEVLIRATILEGSDLPQDTVLVGEKLSEDSEAYQAAKELSRQKTGAGGQASYSFYRIAFLANGREIEPAEGTVSVQLEFKKQKTDDSARLQKVVHIEDRQEVNDVTAQTAEGNSVGSIDFEI